MAFTLDDRTDLRRAFFRLTDTSAADTSLIEQDTESNEAVHYFIQHGLWSAQDFLLSSGAASRWLKVGTAITWSGSDDTGGRYVALPADFLRLAGDENRSALSEANNVRWGQQLNEEESGAYGDYYYLKNERLYLTRGASPQNTLYINYHHRHEVLAADNTTIDFPLLDRPLIVAWAAQHALADNWLPDTAAAKVQQAMAYWKREAASRARRTRQPAKLRAARVDNPGSLI